MKVVRSLIKNGKYYLRPPNDGSDLKALFKRLAVAGVGRPVDKDGFPSGSWTPELLAAAISEIGTNRDGIELRTVQLWFQDNENGISADNIRWLARVFGCDDPVTTSDWQIELSMAQARLTARRRERKKAGNGDRAGVLDSAPKVSVDDRTIHSGEIMPDNGTSEKLSGFSLVKRSEAVFGRGSPLDLPASVFAGAVALGFTAYFLGIHSISYGKADGTIKQVGFLWAPNWTFLFMIFMPLFFAFAVELVVFWKKEARSKLLAAFKNKGEAGQWMQKVEASSYTFWAAFIICVGFAGLFQWIDVRLLPLLNGGEEYAIDWGTLATVRPETISVAAAIAFTGFAYLYMCLCFYLFFVGLILVYTVAHDFGEIERLSERKADALAQRRADAIALRVLSGIFRCTVSGILIAICMKLQSFYLTSSSGTVTEWLFKDASSVVFAHEGTLYWIDYSIPNHYSSLLIVLSTCVVFLYGLGRVSVGGPFVVTSIKMGAAVAVLTLGYLSIGAFSGSPILLNIGVLLATYGLFDPQFGKRRATDLEGDESVS